MVLPEQKYIPFATPRVVYNVIHMLYPPFVPQLLVGEIEDKSQTRDNSNPVMESIEPICQGEMVKAGVQFQFESWIRKSLDWNTLQKHSRFIDKPKWFRPSFLRFGHYHRGWQPMECCEASMDASTGHRLGGARSLVEFTAGLLPFLALPGPSSPWRSHAWPCTGPSALRSRSPHRPAALMRSEPWSLQGSQQFGTAMVDSTTNRRVCVNICISICVYTYICIILCMHIYIYI